MARWEVILPCQPPTLNELTRGTFRARMRLGSRFGSIVFVACRGVVPPATGKRRVGITIILGPRQKGADPDAYHKALGDALVRCWALRDDSRHWVEWLPVQYDRGPHRKTVIVLEDIS
jgi:hypothetical protein